MLLGVARLIFIVIIINAQDLLPIPPTVIRPGLGACNRCNHLILLMGYMICSDVSSRCARTDGLPHTLPLTLRLMTHMALDLPPPPFTYPPLIIHNPSYPPPLRPTSPPP